MITPQVNTVMVCKHNHDHVGQNGKLFPVVRPTLGILHIILKSYYASACFPYPFITFDTTSLRERIVLCI